MKHWLTREIKYGDMTEVITAPVVTPCSQYKLVAWQLLPLQLNRQVTLHHNKHLIISDCIKLNSKK